MSTPPVLILPGLGGSGAKHWQSIWETRYPDYVRVEQQDWDHPRCALWIAALESAVSKCAAPPILVAHSLACLLVPHWAAWSTRPVKGALLVAPPDPNGPAFPAEAEGFTPLPRKRLRFPSIVVASSDDPYATIGFSKGIADHWGSRFEPMGATGHINGDSGLGAWPEGHRLLRFLEA